MTLSQIQRHLPELRHEAESRMLDTGTAYSPTGRTEQNADGEEEPTFATEFMSRCRLAGDSGGDTETRYVRIGGVEVPVVRGGLHLPWDRQVDEGWEWLVTAIGSSTPAALLNKRFRIVGVSTVSQATALRCDVVEV